MKKKVLSVLLASAMVLSMAACNGGDDAGSSAAGGSAAGSSASGADVTTEAEPYVLEELHIVVDGTITATVDSGQDAFIEQWEAAVSERLGHPITLTIDQLDHSDYAGTVSRYLTTGTPGDGQYPDALIMSASMFREYAPTGLLWDMSDAYDNAEFQSRLALPSINENLKDSTGALYGFAPTYGNGCVTYVKQSWLDAAGLKIEDIKTYDDYINMLRKFKENNPKGYGVIAAGYGKLDEAPYINYMPEFWQGAYPDFYQKDGVWVDGFQEQATAEALDRLAAAAAEGLIDPDTEEAGTKQAREKFFSNEQSTSSGVFTYWAGTWLKTLSDNLVKNDVDTELVQLAPIKEIQDTWGGYINREAPVWVITDDGEDNGREQAIFDALLDTMLDGDTVQTLWTYGAEDVHWSTKAETFTTNPGTDTAKDYSYEEGVFHLKQSPNDPNSVWKKNALDPALVVCSLDNGFVDQSELAAEGNKFFTSNCIDAPMSPSSETLTNETGNIYDAKMKVVSSVVVEGGDVEAAMQTYVDTVGATVDQILAELNGQ